ncbi:glycosidase [Vibrio sp. JCM 19236]|nr:glycosidase [Vibrio sp. JCM 19236]
MPSLNDSDYVVEQQQTYLKVLKEMGVKGFRIDAAKHISIEQIRKVWTPEITEGVHILVRSLPMVVRLSRNMSSSLSLI